MSTATASYGVYALTDPRHLGSAVDPKHASDYDLLAHDLRRPRPGDQQRRDPREGPKAVTTAMVIRIALRHLRRPDPRRQAPATRPGRRCSA